MENHEQREEGIEVNIEGVSPLHILAPRGVDHHVLVGQKPARTIGMHRTLIHSVLLSHQVVTQKLLAGSDIEGVQRDGGRWGEGNLQSKVYTVTEILCWATHPP